MTATRRADPATALRRARASAYAGAHEVGWPGRVVLAAGFAGLMALTAQLSIPLPWTPVPFSFQVLGVLVTGAYLGRHYALLSVALYVLAGALGLHVFADGGAGTDVLTGHTTGYIVGFAVAAWFVGWYVQRRRRMDARVAAFLLAGLGVLALASALALVWVVAGGRTFDASYSPGQSLAWLLVGSTVLAALAAIALVRQARGQRTDKLNLFLVMAAGIGVIHAFGVPVLKLSLGWSWSQSLALGSAVFIPFDLVKAALATGLAVATIPTDAAPNIPEKSKESLHA